MSTYGATRSQWVNRCSTEVISGNLKLHCIISKYWDGAGGWNACSHKTPYMVTTIADDDLATQGAMESTAMVLTYL